jgi:hypothetical protein
MYWSFGAVSIADSTRTAYSNTSLQVQSAMFSLGNLLPGLGHYNIFFFLLP